MKPPESSHDRLNRELRRMRLRGWPAMLGTVLLLVAVIAAFIRVPTDVTFTTGTLRGVAQLMSETGAYQRASVDLGDRVVEASMASTILHPAPGDTVCVRRTVDAFTWFERFALAPDSRCGTP